MKIAKNPTVPKVTQTGIVIGNLKLYKTLLSSIFLFGDLVLDMQSAS